MNDKEIGTIVGFLANLAVADIAIGVFTPVFGTQITGLDQVDAAKIIFSLVVGVLLMVMSLSLVKD